MRVSTGFAAQITDAADNQVRAPRLELSGNPRQTDADDAPVTALGRWRLTPRARYDITARILAREDYRFDRLSDLIPEDLTADASVARQLKRLRVGQTVRLTGYLVNAVRDDGVYIRTSMTRSDTGPGSCEVILVARVETL